MGFVFISYSRQDTQVVDRIVSRLKSDGFEVWIDRANIKGGDLWTVAIVEAIDTADSFVLMLSPSSTASDNVRKEVQLAQDAKRRLFPLLLAAVTLPPQFRYQLAGIQLIDYARDPETNYQELVKALQTHRESLIAKIPTTRQVEIVMNDGTIENFGAAEKELLLNTIANLVRTARTNLGLVRLSAGSIHAFIDMPTQSAYVLKTAALNRDKRLLGHGIDAVRLDGEENYVHVHSGEIGPLDLPKRRFPILMLILLIVIGTVIATGFFTKMIGGISGLITPTTTKTLTFTVTSSPSLTITPSSTATITNTPTATPTHTPSPTNTSILHSGSNNLKPASGAITSIDTAKPTSKPLEAKPTQEYKCTLVWDIWYEYDPYKDIYYKKEGWVCK